MKSQRMKEKETAESAEWFRQRMAYDAELGILFWLNNSNVNPSVRLRIAGTKVSDSDGMQYLYVSRGRRVHYRAHRVAWMLFYGEWPHGQIDHKNGNGRDNRISNLRTVDNKQNAMNSRARKSKSGHTGVRWHSVGKKWNARIVVDGKEKSLGMFDEIQDAVKARKAAEQKHGFGPVHGTNR